MVTLTDDKLAAQFNCLGACTSNLGKPIADGVYYGRFGWAVFGEKYLFRDDANILHRLGGNARL